MKKISKCVGFALYYLIAKHLPKSNAMIVGKICKWVRSCLARCFISYCGRNVNLQKKAVFSTRLKIGDNSGIGINCFIQGTVTIGSDVMIGPDVQIYTQNHRHDRIDIPMINQGYEEEKKVTICDDVWIGARAIILPGVTIGKGSVVGAAAVVTKNVPDYSVVAGNPAKVVKNRKFDE